VTAGVAVTPRLYHFSEDPSIEVLHPRTLPHRPEVAEPLVWAIDEPHQFMYLFPRDCPRVLLWPVAGTTAADRAAIFGRSDARVVACVEYAWLDRLRTTTAYRYVLPAETFEDLHDAGMWVSRSTVTPSAVEAIVDLPDALRAAGVELRVMDRLTPLWGLWEETTLHWSSIRMSNAQDWEQAARTVPPALGPAHRPAT
jgi:hypothetical protein